MPAAPWGLSGSRPRRLPRSCRPGCLHRAVLPNTGAPVKTHCDSSTPAVLTMQPFGQVAVQHGQAVLGIRVFLLRRQPRLAIGVQRQEGGVLAESDRGRMPGPRRTCASSLAPPATSHCWMALPSVPLCTLPQDRSSRSARASSPRMPRMRPRAVHVFNVVICRRGGRRLQQGTCAKCGRCRPW